MKLKHLLLNPQDVEGGGTATIPTVTPAATGITRQSAAPVTSTKPVVNAPSKPAPKTGVEFSMDDADADLLGDGTKGSVAETAVVTKPVESTVQKSTEGLAATPPEKVESTPAKTAESKPNMLGKLSGQKGTDARDYTGFSEAEQKVLKSMSNDAFNYVAPILKAQKANTGTTSPNNQQLIYQHPDAYLLHPDYKRYQAESSYAEQEGQAWLSQLIKIQKGEKWTPLVGVDKNGKFVYGEERQPTLEDAEMVRSSMQKCQQVAQVAKYNLDTLPQQFKQQATNDLQGINAERAKRFDWVANPELLNFELELEGVGKTSIANIKTEFKSMWPSYLRETPGVEVASDLFAALQVYGLRLRQAESGKAVAEELKNESRRVEPTSGVGGRGTKSKSVEFSLEGLPT